MPRINPKAKTIGTIIYIAAMSFLVPQAKTRGWGMDVILAIMAVVAGVLILLYWIGYLILDEINYRQQKEGVSRAARKEYQKHGHEAGFFEASTSTALVKAGQPSPRQLQQIASFTSEEYASAVAEALRDDDEEDERDEWSDEWSDPHEQAPQPAEAVIEDGGLDLAENLQPSIQSLTCQNVTFIGLRRIGKSNAEAILLKQLAKRGFPLTVFDTEGEFEELARKQHMPRGVLVGSEQARADAPHGIKFYAIDLASAYNFAQIALEECLQVVVQLTSWSDDDAAMIIAEMITGMEDWQQQRPKERRIPFYIALTEITKWVPQNLGESVLSKESTKAVQHALFDVAVRRGGKRGFALIADTQTYAALDKRVLAGDWKVIFKQTERNDIERLGDAPLKLSSEEISSLSIGESFVFCPQAPRGIFVKWPLCDVKLGGSSPSFDNLRLHHRQLKRSVTGALARLEEYQIRTMLEQSSAQRKTRARQVEQEIESEELEEHGRNPIGQTAAPRTRDSYPPAKSAAVPLMINETRVTLMQKAAYELITEQECTTIAKLAIALTQDGRFGTVAESKAYRVRGELEALGLIQK